MGTLTETHIKQWADRHECRSKLPVLIRRLIRETVHPIETLRFPGNEAVDLAGLDGEVETSDGNTWVPTGRSFWELGCNLDPKRKAQGDYDKRSIEVDAAHRQTSSFIFVTPRRWAGKEDWIKAQKAEGDWMDVRVFDAIDLETWLEEAPTTTRWLGETLGIAQSGLLTPEEWWQRWSTASNPPISHKLVATRRNGVAETILQKLRNGEQVLPVSGDDHSEAVAFVIAAMLEANADDLLDRTLVVTRSDVVIPAAERTRPIIISDLPDGAEIDLRDRRGICLVRAYPKGRLDVREPLELSHVPSEVFRSELEGMGLSKEDAGAISLETGHSIAVLRRRLSPDPDIQRPVWARDRDAVRHLLPFALVGSWSERSDFDDTAILALLGDTSEEDIKTSRDSLLSLEDAPVARYGTNNTIVSRMDALFAIGPQIQIGDLDRFFELAPSLISERDPALDLPSDQWWMANVLGKSRSYSGSVLSGVGDTLCILAVHGDEICGSRLGISIGARVDQTVRTLLSDVDEEGWLTLRDQLRPLAEAAPTTFLDCLEAELRRPNPAIKAIMGTVEGGISGDCLRTGLLWALEALAWHPVHFKRVAAIICDLRRFDVDDNWSNKPSSTAKELFRAWSPTTALSVERRMEVLDGISKTHRTAAIDICLSLLPDGFPRMAMVKSRPRWRALEQDVPVPTNIDVRHSMIEASRILLDMAPFQSDELKTVLEAVDRLHPDDLQRLVSEVKRWANNGKDDEKADLRQVLRSETSNRAYQKKAKNDDALVEALNQMEAAVEPASATERNRWLFEGGHVEWSRLIEAEGEGRLSWQEREKLVRAERQKAIEDIETEDGRDSIIPYALSTKSPGVVADVLVTKETSPLVAADWIKQVLLLDSSEETDAFLRSAFWNLGRGDLVGLVHQLQNDGILDSSDKKRLATCLPGVKLGWEAAAELGPEAESAYWESVHLRIWDDTPSEEAEIAARRLLSAGRARSVFTAFQYSEGKLTSALWAEALDAIASGKEPNGPFPDTYHLDQVFQKLDDDPNITEDRVAQIELPFAPFLSHYGHRNSERTLAVHRAIARDPAFFIQLLSWIYSRRDKVEEPEFAAMAEDRRKHLWDIAYHTLEGWNAVPGMNESGEIDAEAFKEWTENAVELAGGADRLGVANLHLAGLLSRLARRRNWDDWLPSPVLDFIELAERNDLRESFETGVRNARGVTMRGPYDGGAQERELGTEYRKLSSRLGNSHPRVAAMLVRIAESYEWQADQEDDRAAIGERWHP